MHNFGNRIDDSFYGETSNASETGLNDIESSFETLVREGLEIEEGFLRRKDNQILETLSPTAFI
jgi:hypothetical protein